MTATPPFAPRVNIGNAKIFLQNVRLREDVTLDEVHLEGADIQLEAPVGEKPAQLSTGEVQFRATIAEPNLNRMMEANLPPDVPVKNFQIAALSGRIRITMQIVKVLTLPITLEGVPRVENGVRVFLDWKSMQMAGISVPTALVEVIEQQLNKTLDLTKSPVPVWIDEVRCEPGRLTVLGKARIQWPLPPAPPPVAPFTAREKPLDAAAGDSLPAIPASGILSAGPPAAAEDESHSGEDFHNSSES